MRPDAGWEGRLLRRRGRTTRRRTIRTDRSSRLRALWSEFLRPAIVVAAIGAGAVLYISACARVSIMEWDLRTLQQRADERREECILLQRQIAEARKSSVIREHVAEHHLAHAEVTAEVTVSSVPDELLDEATSPAQTGGAQLAEHTSTPAGGTTVIAAAPPAR